MLGTSQNRTVRIKRIQETELSEKEFLDAVRSTDFNVLNVWKGRRSFTLRLPEIHEDWNVYYIDYYSSDFYNNYHFKMEYDMSYCSENEFIATFSEKFSDLKDSLDLLYVSKKIWSISKNHYTAYHKYIRIDVDKACNPYYTVWVNNKKYGLSDLPDGDLSVNDVVVSKVFAVIKGAVLGLGMGSFTLKDGALVKKYNDVLLDFNRKYSIDHLRSYGLIYSDPREMNCWIATNAALDDAVRVCRSVIDDIELKMYLNGKIESCP